MKASNMSNLKHDDKPGVRQRLTFAAIDPYVERNIILPTEQVVRGKDVVEWGDGNAYPDYLLDLYNNVPTLRSIINGTTDYICGNGAEIQPLREGMTAMNRSGETIDEQVRRIALDYMLYGGFALQVIRGADGLPSEIYVLDLRYLRTNKDCTVFYYSEKWTQRYGSKDTVVYPKFLPSLDWARLTDEERDRQASSILFVKNTCTQTYPAPLYAAAVKACEIERCIDDFHLTSIDNGFAPSALVNLNNGVPTDAEKAEITEDFAEKYQGASNAGRVVFIFNETKENAATIDTVSTEDFGARYEALSKHSRQQILTAFHCNPNLIGIPTDGNGFANEQYEESFKLYNRTQVQPVQDIICAAYAKIYGADDVLEIAPFSMGDNDSTDTLATELGVGGTQAMMTVVDSTTMTTEQKKGTLQVLFGLDDEQVAKILGLPYVQPIAEEE